MTEKNYLSDTELENLIRQTEAEELINAPPDFLENVLISIDRMETKTPNIIHLDQRKAEFWTYCFKVISAMAAAITLFVVIPQVNGFQDREIPSKESVIMECVHSREEVLLNSGNRIMSRMNQSHILSDIWKFEIFK